MPETVKFSEAFYDRLGHGVADELVEWTNKVDASSRAELKELNELNFARFDAKLEQRFAEFDAKLEKRFAEFRVAMIDRLDALRGELVDRLSALESKLEGRIGALEVKLEHDLGALNATLERRIGEQSRWLVAIWITVIGAAVALWFRK